jgi:hypothetical protein
MFDPYPTRTVGYANGTTRVAEDSRPDFDRSRSDASAVEIRHHGQFRRY